MRLLLLCMALGFFVGCQTPIGFDVAGATAEVSGTFEEPATIGFDLSVGFDAVELGCMIPFLQRALDCGEPVPTPEVGAGFPSS